MDSIEELNQRREANKGKPRINNASLPAGSPMYFYCNLCGDECDRLPENYTCRPAKHCVSCQKLVDAGWSEAEQRFITYTTITCTKCHGSGKGQRDYYLKRRRRCTKCNGSGKVNV